RLQEPAVRAFLAKPNGNPRYSSQPPQVWLAALTFHTLWLFSGRERQSHDKRCESACVKQGKMSESPVALVKKRDETCCFISLFTYLVRQPWARLWPSTI